jgi:hypothetical protein
MRIKVIQTPTRPDVDGIRLDLFHPGIQYEMGNLLGALFFAEGWGVPVASDEPAMIIPISEPTADRQRPSPNLTREIFPSYLDLPSALAADRRRRPRAPRK